jgi:hypothetical protein
LYTKPTLVVLAAGIGSRFGGLKQIEPVDPQGQMLIDYSIYDAKRAGFEKVVCVISHALEQDFHERIGKRIEKHVDLCYAFQDLYDLPSGFTVPLERTKPWGTAHAALTAKKFVDGAFATINADDFYGADAYQKIFDFLTKNTDETRHAMVGYKLRHTLTENGSVARGVCAVEDGLLQAITERTHIESKDGQAVYLNPDQQWIPLPDDTIVSMNLWGFGHSMMQEIEDRFAGFLTENLPQDPNKCEYFLPSVPGALLLEKKAVFQVLHTDAQWYGVTYQQDRPSVCAAIANLKAQAAYPAFLWR